MVVAICYNEMPASQQEVRHEQASQFGYPTKPMSACRRCQSEPVVAQPIYSPGDRL